MNNYTFDCTPFQKNFPDLALKVKKECQKIGIKGLNNIKLSWAEATGFVRHNSKLYWELVKFKANIDNARKRLKGTRIADYPDKAIERVTDTRSPNTLTKNLRHQNKLSEESGNTAGVVRAVRGS